MDLQVNENIDHEKLKWRIERTGWIIMLIIIFAALGGFLGQGPFSSKTKKAKNLSIEYFSIERYQAPSYYKIFISEIPGNGNNEIKLSLNRDLVESIFINRIDPQPDKTFTGGNNIYFTFPVSKYTSNLEIQIHFEGKKVGNVPAEIEYNDAEKLVFNQYFYP